MFSCTHLALASQYVHSYSSSLKFVWRPFGKSKLYFPQDASRIRDWAEFFREKSPILWNYWTLNTHFPGAKYSSIADEMIDFFLFLSYLRVWFPTSYLSVFSFCCRRKYIGKSPKRCGNDVIVFLNQNKLNTQLHHLLTLGYFNLYKA